MKRNKAAAALRRDIDRHPVRRPLFKISAAEAAQQIEREHGGRWVVRCRVSGGMTGTRESVLQRDGVVQVFATEAEAQAKAAHLVRQMNTAYSTAHFQYWAAQEGGAL